MKIFLKAFFRQFKDITVILLICCIVIGGVISRLQENDNFTDNAVIAAILFLNGLFGAYQEYRAEKTLGDIIIKRPSPLQKRLSETGGVLCAVALGFCAVIFITGILKGENAFDMLMTALSLGVAAIPESLPAIVTIMLSAGICGLSKAGAKVRRLNSAEGLGRISCLFLNIEKLSQTEKNSLRRAGIKLGDIKDREAFFAFKKKSETIGAIGYEKDDIHIMELSDISCCMDGRTELYGYSHIIFKDFGAIYEAVKIGRGIYDNFEKSLHFLISCNIGEILTVFAAIGFSGRIPLLAVHLLMVNLITDCLPAIALSLEPGDEDIMEKKAVGNENIFDKSFICALVFEGLVIGGASLLAFVFGSLYGGIKTGRTMTFCVLCISQLFHSFNMRRGAYLKNIFLDVSFAAGMALTVAAAVLPGMSRVFGLETLAPVLWFDVFLLSLIPFFIFESIKKLFPKV